MLVRVGDLEGGSVMLSYFNWEGRLVLDFVFDITSCLLATSELLVTRLDDKWQSLGQRQGSPMLGEHMVSHRQSQFIILRIQIDQSFWTAIT
jgi:hypothetical protein